MKYKTKGNASPQGKPRVYLTGHPADVKQHFENITDAILKFHNCAIFYDEDPEHPEDGENFISDLDRMQLIVLVVTSRYVYGDTFAHSAVFQHAMERHIPVLPILEENGIERDFDKKCGNLQYLDPNVKDDTAISFEDKLKKFLDSVLVGDELAAKVRAAFDAYVFLSYRKKDRRYAQQLMRLIHENPFCRDIAIWYDEFLVPGEDFNDAIRRAMEKSELFALVVTPNLLEASNYIMSTEYPAARESGKPILPAMLVPTDGRELAARYEAIPTPIDPTQEGALPAALRTALAAVNEPGNDNEPQHIFFIGLAYLSGIDVEVNYTLAVQLITRAAEAGLPEAMEKLVSMYRTGEGVGRDYRTAIHWQEKLAEAYRAAYETAPDEEGGKRWFNSLYGLVDFWYELRQLAQAGKACHEMLDAGQRLDKAYHAVWTRRSLSVCYKKLGDISQAQGDLAGAKAFYEKGLAVSERLAAETDNVETQQELSTSYDRMGYISWMQKDLAGAKVFYEKGLAVNERLAVETEAAEARENLAFSYDNLGNVSREQGDLAGAKALYEKGLAIRERLAKETGTAQAWQVLAISYHNLGQTSLAQGDLAGAKVFFQKCFAVSERLAAETGTVEARRGLSISYSVLGDLCQAQGDLAGAGALYEKSLAIRERLAEETGTVEARRDLANSCKHLGDIIRTRGDLAGAKALFEKALAIDERLAAETGTMQARRDLAASYNRLGDLSQKQGDLAGAKAFHEKCLAISERFVAETGTAEARQGLAASYSMLGNVSLAQGDLAEAKTLYEKCLAIAEQLAAETGTVEAQRDLAVSYNRLGDIRRAQGDPAGAKTFYEKCLAAFERLAAKTNAAGAWRDVAALYDQLGDLSKKQGDPAGARAFYGKSLTIYARLASETSTAKAYDDLAISYLRLSDVHTAEEQQEYLRKAAAIWGVLAAQCPNVPAYRERLAAVQKFIR